MICEVMYFGDADHDRWKGGMDLRFMLVGGRMWSVPEYFALMESVGFRNVNAVNAASGGFTIVTRQKD